MSTRSADIPLAPAVATPDLGLEPLTSMKRRWPTVIGLLLTVAMLGGLANELFGSGLGGLIRSVPTDPRFYLIFVTLYMVPQTVDYLIFRRLWGLPIAGLTALTKKRIANDVLIGYSGEAYFYAWARVRASMVRAPFGAVKDVSILSAIAGNALTLTLIAVALPLGMGLLTHDQLNIVAGSAAIVMATSVPFLVFSRRVFSLERGALWWIFGMHCVRICLGSTLLALAWHFALPDVPIGMWLFLAAARLLVTRLPLVPNKDLLFANFAILLIGQDQAVAEMIAFIAAATLMMHGVVMAGVGLREIANRL